MVQSSTLNLILGILLVDSTIQHKLIQQEESLSESQTVCLWQEAWLEGERA